MLAVALSRLSNRSCSSKMVGTWEQPHLTYCQETTYGVPTALPPWLDMGNTDFVCPDEPLGGRKWPLINFYTTPC